MHVRVGVLLSGLTLTGMAQQQRGQPMRTVRIDDELWARVKARASDEGLTPSEVIRLLLEGWVESPRG